MEHARISVQDAPKSSLERIDVRISADTPGTAEKALRKAQDAFKGQRSKGVKIDEDIQRLVDEVRYG